MKLNKYVNKIDIQSSITNRNAKNSTNFSRQIFYK